MKTFSISFYFREIYIQNGDEDVERLARDVIYSEVGKLVKNETRLEQEKTLVFKLKNEISINSDHKTMTLLAKMMSKLFDELKKVGWIWEISTCLSQGDVPSTVYFRKVVTQPNPPLEPVVALSLTSSNMLLVLAEAQTSQKLLQVVQENYSNGIKKSKLKKDGSLSVELKGHPWGSNIVDPEDATLGKKLVLRLIEELHQIGFKFYSNVCIDGKLDSLFFIKCTADMESVGHANFFMIALHDPPESIDPTATVDQLVLINAPTEATKSVHAHLQKSWPSFSGTFQEGTVSDTMAFNLVGAPWNAREWDSADAKAKVGQLIRHLHTQGWSLVCSLKLSISKKSMSNFIFKESSKNLSPMFTMAFNRRSSVYLMNAPKEIQSLIFDTINQYWSLRLKHFEKSPNNDNSVLMKLFGSPFDQFATTTTFLNLRSLMTILIEKLDEAGWQVLTSSDVSASHTYWPKKLSYSNPLPKYDVHSHTWYVIKT